MPAAEPPNVPVYVVSSNIIRCCYPMLHASYFMSHISMGHYSILASVNGSNCVNSTTMNLTFWSLWQWNANDFNNFTTDITVSPSLASCKNIQLFLGRGVDQRVAVLIDDIQFIAKSTPNPMPSPTLSTFSPQGMQPTYSPSIHKTLVPTVSAIACPTIGNGPMTLTSSTVMIQFANAGVLCTLVKVTGSNNSSNITTIVPLARSYDGFVWEIAAGDYAASFASSALFQCYSHGCQFKLPNFASSNEWFQLRSYQYSLPETDQLARLLERTSFGITQSDLKAISSLPFLVTGNVSMNTLSVKMAQWVRLQMMANATSHREFWRLRANPRVRNGIIIVLKQWFLLIYSYHADPFPNNIFSCKGLPSSDSQINLVRLEPDSDALLLYEMIFLLVGPRVAFEFHPILIRSYYD